MIYEGLVYDRELKKEELCKEHKLVLELVGKSKDILEVGCHTGYFTELLQNNGCEVVGVEVDPRAASKAEQFAKKIIIGDIEDEDVLAQINQKFDVILFIHVLEHLVNPWKTLKETRQFLKSNGYVLIATPNVACWTVRKDLFFKGKFEYTDVGILDKTHLRFFTLATGQDLIQDSGYEIENWYITWATVPFAGKLGKVPLLQKLVPYWSSLLTTHFPNLCGAVFLFKAKAH